MRHSDGVSQAKSAVEARRQAALSPECIPVGRHSAMIDTEKLMQQSCGDTALAGELLALFRHHAAKISVQFQNGSVLPAAIADLAHRLRGSALAVGAMQVAGAAAELEQAALGSQTPDLCDARIRDVIRAIAQSDDAIADDAIAKLRAHL